MSLFDDLVDEAMEEQQELAPLRIVVEKELLHHDILREMANANLLRDITFIGGTCLRACYGSNRLSEDLDFAGGRDFNRSQLTELASVLVDKLQDKYGLRVNVSEPRREEGNVDTWRLQVQTRPGQKHMPAQRINIDVSAVPSHDPQPMMIRNHYGVDMGTSGLILSAESRHEILADKLVAFALRPNRIKNRDLWDILWLQQQGIVLPLQLVPLKIADHGRELPAFLNLLQIRKQSLLSDSLLHTSFVSEMNRFLPVSIVTGTVPNPDFWRILTRLVSEECDRVERYLHRL